MNCFYPSGDFLLYMLCNLHVVSCSVGMRRNFSDVYRSEPPLRCCQQPLPFDVTCLVMTSKTEKDKAKQLQDKCQSVLNGLLRDEDNKYCVDCDSKGG